jgi:hypothetical protein
MSITVKIVEALRASGHDFPASDKPEVLHALASEIRAKGHEPLATDHFATGIDWLYTGSGDGRLPTPPFPPGAPERHHACAVADAWFDYAALALDGSS